ncbi:MAG TPA: polymer-forming cytoskeletal protein [Polyangiaceae bacterium]|jgi:cytoskeletal protein CcmA (bactofilin family)|nr:polymer-forming cytoskeletal protein [Polyangiaceae bacterium]
MDKSKISSGKQTLVEEGTELKGTLKSSCQVVVNGTIDGTIEAPSLTIAETGTVLGNVKAAKLRSEGTLAGNIDAEEVYLSGTVRSNTMIRANKLEVKLSQERGKLEVTFGECLLEVGDDPAKKADAPKDGPAPMLAKPESAVLAPAVADGPLSARVNAELAKGENDDPVRRGGQKKNAERRESQPPPAE